MSDLTSATRYTDTTATLAQVSAAANDRPEAVDKGLSSVHRGQRRLSRQQVSSTAQIINSIQSASDALSHEIASLMLTEQDHRFFSEGVNLEVLTAPLTLMR
jgi:acyl-CoA reductase-like NAD-dependent aldehyde dehydrogenase